MFDAIEQHLLGAGDVATLERHGRKPAVGPLVQRGEFPSLLGEGASGLEVSAGEGEFESREDAVDTFGVDFHGLVDVRLSGVEASMLAVPAAACQPRLDVLRLILDEPVEHLARRLLVIEPILEDRSEDEVRLGRHRGRFLGHELPCVHVEADHR